LIPFFPGLYGGKWGNYLGQDEPGTNGVINKKCSRLLHNNDIIKSVQGYRMLFIKGYYRQHFKANNSVFIKSS